MDLEQGQERAAPHSDDRPWPDIRLSDTDRLEAFSDGVFAITITLLVFDIVRPEYVPGHLFRQIAGAVDQLYRFSGVILLRGNYLA